MGTTLVTLGNTTRRMQMQYIPVSWKLGKLMLVDSVSAQVVECDRAGHELGKSLKLNLNQRRTFILSVRHGINFSDHPVDPRDGKVRVGDKVVFELRHNDHDVPYIHGWATLEDYKIASGLYNRTFSPQVISLRQRLVNPPDDRRVPNHQYVTERWSGPMDVRLGALDLVKLKLDQAPVVHYYPHDPDFERSLTAEELLKVKVMSKYARQRFRRFKKGLLVTA